MRYFLILLFLFAASNAFSNVAQSFEPEMVRIPGGTFRMGCVSGKSCRNGEKPVHRVNIPSFYLGKYVVTFDEWDACVMAGGCNGYKPKDEGWGRGNRPVINVSWDDAVAYSKWLSDKTGQTYRLPSEAEWEYAARAGTTTKYAFGDTISKSQAQFSEGSYGSAGKTVKVGSFRANVFGLHDMHGNVWEWTGDCWNDNYKKMPVKTKQTGTAWTTGNCSRPVVRGGSWYYGPRYLRSAFRDWYDTGLRSFYVGFRLARTLNVKR